MGLSRCFSKNINGLCSCLSCLHLELSSLKLIAEAKCILIWKLFLQFDGRLISDQYLGESERALSLHRTLAPERMLNFIAYKTLRHTSEVRPASQRHA